MMFADPATRGLIWKETRQVIPLVAIVAAVGFAVMLLNLVVESISPQASMWGSTIPWVLPACFAAGAGALLVGHEKEQKTLDWLAALPNPPMRTILVKFGVAIAALFLVWLIAGILSIFGGRGYQNSAVGYGIFPAVKVDPVFAVQSLLVLVVGFYTAWRTNNTFTGLMLLIPIACGPAIVNQIVGVIYRDVTGARLIPSGLSESVFIVLSIAWTILFAWLAVRAASIALSPAAAISVNRLDSVSLLDLGRPTVSAPAHSFRYSLSSFVWQYVQYHRWTLVLISTVIVVGAYCTSLIGSTEWNSSWSRTYENWCAAAAGASGLAVSWLGVMAFAGDGQASRLRFLADRGVSPAKVWLGRQIVGVSLLSVGILAYFLFTWWNLSSGLKGDQIVSVALIGLVIWCIYWTSQWISQAIPILAGAAIVAPIISVVAIFWAGYSATTFGAPLWLLLVCSLLPIAATLFSMRRYMDEQRGWVSIASALAVILLCLILPAVPFAVRIAGYPDISAKQKSQMFAAANSIKATQTTGIQLAHTPANGVQLNLFLTGPELLTSYEKTDFGPRSRFVWRRPTPSSSSALTDRSDVAQRTVQGGTFARVDYELSPSDDNADSLREWIGVTTEFAARLRQSHRLDDQNAADILEIWLVDTLRSNSIRGMKAIEFGPTIELLENQSGRSQARRRAVLVSWKNSLRWLEGGDDAPILERAFSEPWWRFPSRSPLTQKKQLNQIAARLLNLIDAAERDASLTEPLNELRKVATGIDWASKNDSYSEQFRSNISLDSIGRYGWDVPQLGSLWYASWEQEAIEIARLLKDVQPKHDLPNTNEGTGEQAQ